MNKQTEALKMVVEAKKRHGDGWWVCDEVIQACKEALEQEEVSDAELISYKQGYEQGKFDALMDAELKKSEYKFDHPDYGELTQIAEQPAQEPVAWIKEYELLGIKSHKKMGATNWNTNLGLKPEPDDVPLYTHPAPNKVLNENTPDNVWQGLSDDEKEAIIYDKMGVLPTPFEMKLAEAIEQALKEKNHGN